MPHNHDAWALMAYSSETRPNLSASARTFRVNKSKRNSITGGHTRQRTSSMSAERDYKKNPDRNSFYGDLCHRLARRSHGNPSPACLPGAYSA